MIAWNDIDTVLLDMDGTLLDLAFDNWFWQQVVPQKYAETKGIPDDQAHRLIKEWIDRHQGTLNWYCLDFWSAELGLDIAGLKREVGDRVCYRPGAEAFLQALRNSGRQIVMVTNAHPDALAVKKTHTGLEQYFDQLITSHELGSAKESAPFWEALQGRLPFDRQRSILVDDSLPVLQAGHDYGVGHLWSILHPDSTLPPRPHTNPFPAIDQFAHVTPGLVMPTAASARAHNE
ncbi:MAG: haloacid dehalogenase [Gammaproteobacteria bacterium HGW-Gammaproteobacteria-14]|nr:MAG: haloacid dehalogenase [Gammaproteobacteria bacterium HGW-Gammaproteobacteria-14]